MAIEPEGASVADIISNATAGLSLGLSERQHQQLSVFVDLLQRWSRVYNLTAVRDPLEVARVHVVDCLAPVPSLRRKVGNAPSGRLLDVGSGAGLPGLVIAVCQPDWRVTCAEPAGKKAAFIRQAAASLELGNVDVMAERVEDARVEVPFPIIISRAFASLHDFVARTDHLLETGGCWVAMKAKLLGDELDRLDSVAFHVEPLHVPGSSTERCLVWLERSLESVRTLRTSNRHVLE